MISDSSLFGGETTFVMKSWYHDFNLLEGVSESSKAIKCVTQNTNTFYKHKTYKINSLKNKITYAIEINWILIERYTVLI